MDQAWVYELRVEGELPRDWSNWFEGMDIRCGPPGESVLTGRFTDQAALHGILTKIRDLNLKLISVTRKDPPARSCDDERKGENDEGSNRRV